MLLLLAALQAATPAPAPAAAAGERFSILLPTPAAPCRQRLPDDDDIVVCSTTEASQRLPLPQERSPPNGPVESNPNLDGRGALAAMQTPCASVQSGCQVGVDVFGMGTAVVRTIQKVVAPGSCCEAPGEGTSFVGLLGDVIGGVKGAAKKKPDKAGRIPIPLDDPAPPRPIAAP